MSARCCLAQRSSVPDGSLLGLSTSPETLIDPGRAVGAPAAQPHGATANASAIAMSFKVRGAD
jgi:hypothetical protein